MRMTWVKSIPRESQKEKHGGPSGGQGMGLCMDPDGQQIRAESGQWLAIYLSAIAYR